MTSDPTQDRTDRYGRTLAYLDKADGWDYSVEAVRSGAAKSYVYRNEPAVKYPEIAAAERDDTIRGDASTSWFRLAALVLAVASLAAVLINRRIPT